MYVRLLALECVVALGVLRFKRAALSCSQPGGVCGVESFDVRQRQSIASGKRSASFLEHVARM